MDRISILPESRAIFMAPHAVLLDFDGVIADTENHHIAAWQRTLRPWAGRFPTRSRPDLPTWTTGSSSATCWRSSRSPTATSTAGCAEADAHDQHAP